ncbi:MAG: dicarboxylate/amino acid:cation symporter, partial [Bacteroidales bacterium]|nr:dicarboxylate/amino acid:cation symporter [Bacteroidales bacterium]
MNDKKQIIIWIAALVLGAAIGLLNIGWINDGADFIATVYVRLFQVLAVPTVALAVVTTLASFGNQKETGRVFRHTITYTLLTTFFAALVGLALYVIIDPGNLPAELISRGNSDVPDNIGSLSYSEHFISVVPNNILRPILEGNVLSVLIIAFAVGIALAKMPESEEKSIVVKGFLGIQAVIFTLIRGLIWTLPLGIVAFAAQLSVQVSAGVAIESLGKYVAVIIGGNAVQFFIVLPLFLIARGLNPVKVLRAMVPAVLMALFTKSSAATLPVTMQSAEERLKVSPRISRVVLPICTTINMNGCAAFILVTSLFV